MASLTIHDWFFVMLRQPTSLSLSALIVLWTILLCVFAAIYVWVDRINTADNCGLGKAGDPIEWGAAFAFSLETCSTVGYGLPNSVNSFFSQGCYPVVIAIYLQMVWSMLFNAFMVTFMYSRLGRAETRGIQVVMGNKAIVNVNQEGQVQLQIRVFDLDARYPVCDAHVRLYAVLKGRPVPRPLRVLRPNDEFGATLLLSLPSVVHHHIDVYSLLHPPVQTPVMAGGLDLRQVDSTIVSREEIICPICSVSFGEFCFSVYNSGRERSETSCESTT